MLIGIHSFYTVYNTLNAIFDAKSYSIGENLEYPSILLKKKLEEQGHLLCTLDMHELSEFEKIIFYDLPDIRDIDLRMLYKKGIDLYLVIFESEIIKPDNWKINNHKYFKKIFVWNEDWVYGNKYHLFKVPQKISEPLHVKKKKLCTMISCNKSNRDKRELYSERRKAIRWFEKNHPYDFDLFGIGWNLRKFQSPFGRLNKISFLTKSFYKKYPSYQGTIDSKRDVLSQYQFSICYENAKNIKGYITEKIFDCFLSGTIPIYLGAPNIKDYIPNRTFIDRRDYDSYEDLYQFIKNMPSKFYNEYLLNIDNFINSDKIKIFSAEYYSNYLVKQLLCS